MSNKLDRAMLRLPGVSLAFRKFVSGSYFLVITLGGLWATYVEINGSRIIHSTEYTFSRSIHTSVGFTDAPPVFRNHSDIKWGTSEFPNVIEERASTVKKLNVSTEKPLDLNLTILDNPDSEKAYRVNTSALFGNFNETGGARGNLSESEKIYESLCSHKIIPDVLQSNLTTTSLKCLQVKYGTEAVKYGTELYSLQIENEPVVVFRGERQTYYTLIAIGPDMPSYTEHDERNWLHWCVGNIPEGNVSRGQVMTPYCGLTLGYELGPHRIVFLLYKQPKRKRLNFEESEFSDRLDFFRRGFYNPHTFVQRYNLTGPVAVNYLIGLWENEIHQAGSIYQ
nr:PREDICTED: uncharacterized protein LOC109041436 [Bemisia tabaci]